MKKSILLLILSFTLLNTFAQTYDPSKVNKKAVELYNQAIERAQDQNYSLAIGLLLKAIEIDKNYLEAYLSLGGVYGQMKNYSKSVEYYDRAFPIDPNYTIEY